MLIGRRGPAERPLPALRFITNTGQGLPVATFEAVRRTFPRAALFSMYRLSECQRVPNLPAGDAGELLVRGAHIMQGYWKATAAGRPDERLGQTVLALPRTPNGKVDRRALAGWPA